MSLLRSVWTEIAVYCDYVRRSDAEWVIVFATAGILLSTGDSICSWALPWISGSAAGAFRELDRNMRIVIGGGTLALSFLAVVFGRHWWIGYRQGALGWYREERARRRPRT